MEKGFKVVSPVDGSVYAERAYATIEEINRTLRSGQEASLEWKLIPLEKRKVICQEATNYLVSKADELGLEITHQMGRPIRYTPNELRGGLKERAEYMINIADKALADIRIDENRHISREALGVVLILAPWNYPYLTSVNAIIPALLAGNSVILKHSEQTPLTSERYAEAFKHAGLPKGVFQYLHINHDQVAALISKEEVDYVAFTGSVDGGHAIQKAAHQRFISTGLELGGKDAAYIRSDADLETAVANCVDGAFFNSGQSCCGIERIYVDHLLYDEFVAKFVELTKKYILGNPLKPDTEIGPMISDEAARRVRMQINKAVSQGARRHIDNDQNGNSAYIFPEVLTNVTQDMEIMKKETFGPVVGIMSVDNDDEAVNLMNDSEYGLTCSIWTIDKNKALELGKRIETGTVFMNRCDYLDPALAWTGVKKSGKGSTLSELGFHALTRPKSFHFKIL